jgi:hypothetical protein
MYQQPLLISLQKNMLVTEVAKLCKQSLQTTNGKMVRHIHQAPMGKKSQPIAD